MLWLPAASFSPNPLSRFANIIDQLADDVRNKIDIKLIGPANSTGLQSMIRELHRQPLGADAKETLKDVSIISPLATASDDTLLFQPTPAGGGADVRPASPRKTVQMFLEEAVPGLTFFRTIATDEVILKELMAELARRRVPVVQQTTPDERPDPKLAHVVILTEWDTPYARFSQPKLPVEPLMRSLGSRISGRHGCTRTVICAELTDNCQAIRPKRVSATRRKKPSLGRTRLRSRQRKD